MTREKAEAYRLRITQGNRSEIICILYEIFFTDIEDARAALLKGDKEGQHEALSHASQVLRHLKDALDFTYTLAAQLYPLYTFCENALARSIYKANEEGVLEAERIMRPLQEAFQTVASADDSPPVMQHTQKVVAGLTYGRGNGGGSLNEMLEEGGSSRGFLA